MINDLVIGAGKSRLLHAFRRKKIVRKAQFNFTDFVETIHKRIGYRKIKAFQ